MFDNATKKLVRQIDPNGSLIAASLNDSKKLQVLAVVLKKKKVWFWQQTKYRPTAFTLNHLLVGKAIKPVCDQKVFVNYDGTHKNTKTGSVEVGYSDVGINVNGQGSSKLHLSLGTLKKEDVNIPKLVSDCRKRKINLGHSLIQQTLKRKKVFTLLKERIFTTCDCSITYKGQEKAACSAVVKSCFYQILMQESGKLQNDAEINLQIPPDTVMAYSVAEMQIGSDGSFDLCVEPRGIEDDVCEVDGHWTSVEIQRGSSLTSLNKELRTIQRRFFSLSVLDAEARSSILLMLKTILLDRPVLATLVDALEALSSGEAPHLLNNESPEKHSHVTGAFLKLLKCQHQDTPAPPSEASSNHCSSCLSAANHSGSSSSTQPNGPIGPQEAQNVPHSRQNACRRKEENTQLLQAMHMLISALEELSDVALNLLEPFCTLDGLRCLQGLVSCVTGSGWSEAVLNVEVFHKAERLFKACGVVLSCEDQTLQAKVTCGEGFVPLVLCIAVLGLASLTAAQ